MKSRIIIAICALMFAFAAPAAAILGTPETLEGTIQSISENTLAILSQDGSVQKMVEIFINAETQFEATTSLESLQEGDKVTVQYKEEGDQKIAVSIAKVTTTETSQAPEAQI